MADMRFVSVSLIIHAILVLLGGSVVLIKNIVETPDFIAGDGEIYTPGDASTQAPPDSPKPPDTPQLEPVSPKLPMASLEAITSAATTSTFQIAAGPSLPKMDGKLVEKMAGGGKGLGEKLAGLGGGMRGGTKGFFGMRETKEGRGIGLVGNFYDAKQTRDRKPTNVDVNQFSALITKFVNEGWKDSVLKEYYKAPNTLMATQIFIPNMSANEGPKAFEVDKEVQPSRWLVHYRCRISPPRDGNFRFVGAGDDYLVVRLNNKVVLDHGFAKATDWKPDRYYDYGWTGVPNGFARGDKFRAVTGQYYDLEVLVSERPGGLVFFCLMMEDQDKEYAKDGKGNPILPVFRLLDAAMPELEKGQTLPPFEANGPVWRSQPYRGGSGFGQFFGAN